MVIYFKGRQKKQFRAAHTTTGGGALRYAPPKNTTFFSLLLTSPRLDIQIYMPMMMGMMDNIMFKIYAINNYSLLLLRMFTDIEKVMIRFHLILVKIIMIKTCTYIHMCLFNI